jgi:hypothetical protein
MFGTRCQRPPIGAREIEFGGNALTAAAAVLVNQARRAVMAERGRRVSRAGDRRFDLRRWRVGALVGGKFDDVRLCDLYGPPFPAIEFVTGDSLELPSKGVELRDIGWFIERCALDFLKNFARHNDADACCSSQHAETDAGRSGYSGATNRG